MTVMLFAWIAGVELDVKKVWVYRRETLVTAGLALGTPLLFGRAAAVGMLMFGGCIGAKSMSWQFVLGVGMACAMTAITVLILLIKKLDILRQPIGQRILRYASVDDLAIGGLPTLILMDWERVGRQGAFLLIFPVACFAFRKLMCGCRSATVAISA